MRSSKTGFFAQFWPTANASFSGSGKGLFVFAPWLVVLPLVLVGEGLGAASQHSQPTCLSVSPLRAIPSLTGVSDSLGPEGWRDQVLKALKAMRRDSVWFFRKAGECPQGMAALDVFQNPGDVVASPGGQALRIRMEWRHLPGQTDFFLPGFGAMAPDAQRIAVQLMAVADQMMAMVEISSTPPGAVVAWGAVGEDRRLSKAPLVLLVPPGALSLEMTYQDRIKRIDTLVDIGGFYEVHSDFRASRIDPKLQVEPRVWPLWTLTLASALGGAWAAREQVIAERSYSRLRSGADPALFSARWDRLRTANILRNGFFSASLVFGVGTAWMEWSNAHKN